MINSPRVIQLSRLRSPTFRRGRPYTVDFGIAKPLHKQLLSKLRPIALSRIKPPTNYLLHCPARTSRRAVLLLIPLLLAVYVAVIMPLSATQKIVYADPIIQPAAQPVVPMLTMPTVASVEPAQTLLYALATGLPNLYTPGQCTYGVASRIPIPDNWGNANEWSANAAAQGYTVSDTPKVGSIAQTGGDSYLGHVAIVTAVSPDGSFTVWEENYYGQGVTDERTTSTLEFPNFIYI